MMLSIDIHPLLDAGIFASRYPSPLGALASPAWLRDMLRIGVEAPLQRDEEVRQSVRSMLRHAGYRPTGRGKPASEYLVRAAEEGGLNSINAAVDICNVVSLHSGLPISLVDLDRAVPPLRIAAAAEGDSYVFNASEQVIDLAGLLCLADAGGPCANAVKDSQRTKTNDATSRTLTVVWGVRGFEARTMAAVAWYRELVLRLGGVNEDIDVVSATTPTILGRGAGGQSNS